MLRVLEPTMNDRPVNDTYRTQSGDSDGLDECTTKEPDYEERQC